MKSRHEPFAVIDSLDDQELERLNALLPWSAFSLDSNNRVFGRAHSAKKRIKPESLLDNRIKKLNELFPLDELHVLEVGCFEGFHTQALCKLAQRVTAIDSRIEHVVKTIVRCHLMGYCPSVYLWNLEERMPSVVEPSCDILHHVGVLYHLSNPVEHMLEVTEFTRRGIMLDCHIAPEAHPELKTAVCEDIEYQYLGQHESGRDAPFAGMRDHAKWLTLPTIEAVFERQHFATLSVETREERNGLRVLIYAERTD